MKKIINGRRYDTDSAKFLGSNSYGNLRDFHHWHEELYRKNTGEFFLYGKGGPMSRYAEAVDANSWCGGERIIPLTVEAAKKWAEENLEADDYEKIFEVEEDTQNKRVVSLSLTEDVIAVISNMAASMGITKSEVVERAIKSSHEISHAAR